MKLKKLNDTQKREVLDLLKYYKNFYICNYCGSVYGADHLEILKICPKCDLLKQKEKKRKKSKW